MAPARFWSFSRTPERWLRRWASNLLWVAAWFSLLLGLVVLGAWHWQITPIIQVMPGSPPIRYNTALTFVFSGLALMLLQSQRWQRWSLVPGGLVLAIGGLTLVQYLWQVDLGIDQLWMRDYLTEQLYDPEQNPNPWLTEPIQQFFIRVDRPLPGRPSPNTALAFSLVGTALTMLGLPQPPQARWHNPIALAGLSAGGVIGIGSVVLLGYIAELSTFHDWRYITGISVPTALGLWLLGLGILTHALKLRPGRGLGWPRWFPLSMGIGVAMASLFLWQALLSWKWNFASRIPHLAFELEDLLTPVATIVLLGGLLLALLLMGVLYFDQGVRAQANRLKQLNDVLEETRSVLAATLEATADSILVVDIAGRVVHYNSRFIQLWGLSALLVETLRAGGLAQTFLDFVLTQVSDPKAFRATTQHALTDWEQKTFGVVHLQDGRVLECYGHPHWMGDRVVGKVFNYRDVTERYQSEATLRDSEARYRSLVAALAEGVVLQDATGAVQTCNGRAEEILGLTLAEMQGHSPLHPRWRSLREDGSPLPGEQHPAMVSLRTGQPCRNVEMGVYKPNGDLTWIRVNAQPMVHGDGQPPYAVVTSFTDITDRRRMEAALFHEKELAQVALHSIGDAVITTDVAGRIEYVNPMAESLTGWSQAEARGLLLGDILTILHESTREPASNLVDLALAERRTVKLNRDTVLIDRNGREIGIDDSAAPIRDRQGNIVGAVLVFHDVTQAMLLGRQVLWQAKYDPLTGLVNRREFKQCLTQALQTVRTLNDHHVLCYLDLDQFKVINDTCGHNAGDELLRQVSVLLQSCLCKTDILARLGGDEFGVLLHQCDLDEALRVANTLRETLKTFRFTWQDDAFTVGVSIGLVAIDGQSESLEQLLIAADSACYAAKSNGRNRIHTYDADDATLLLQQGEMRWATRLPQALEANRFCLFAQPIVATAGYREPASHYEVLLRLRDESGALVPPIVFLPAAERYGLMVSIDRWVVTTLFQQWHRLQTAAAPCMYAINLSGASINDDQMIDFLRHSLDHYGVPPELVCFEITETMAIANLAQANQLIQQLRALGCRFALDDFGSGMSSFAYLKHLPVDYLKIDGGFVKDILTDPVDEAMVEAINHIGQVMGLQTIAEYVENEAILERLTTLGVNFAQGYGIAKPSPLVSIEEPTPPGEGA